MSERCPRCSGVGYVLEEFWGGVAVVMCMTCYGRGMKEWQKHDQKPIPKVVEP